MDDSIKVIDCFGDICPVPVLKMEEQLRKMKPGDKFMLVTDHSCSVEAIKEKYRNHPADLRVEEVMNGVWEVYIIKN